LPLLVLWYLLIAVDGWTVLLTMISFLLFLPFLNAEGLLLFVWIGNTLILAWKHRADLSAVPQPRPWIRKALRL